MALHVVCHDLALSPYYSVLFHQDGSVFDLIVLSQLATCTRARALRQSAGRIGGAIVNYLSLSQVGRRKLELEHPLL